MRGMHPLQAAGVPGLDTGPLLLFDERCSVCRRVVALLVRADRRGLLRIAPLQGAYGRLVRQACPWLEAMDSALWVEPGRLPRAYADAFLAAARYLGGTWGVLARVAALIPRRLRDWAYRTFAEHRGLFGRWGLAEFDEPTRRRLLPDPDTRSDDGTA